MADEITLEQDIEEVLDWAQTADVDVRGVERHRFEATGEPEDEVDEASEDGADEDEED